MSRPSISMLPPVGSISRSTVRPTVDLPQPDSPTRPSVSPARIEKLTPSTANTVPAARCNSPLRTGKCFLRSRTSSTAGADASAMAVTEQFGRAPARRPVARPFLLVGRIFARGSGRSACAQRGANTQPAGRSVKSRHHAGDFLQAAGIARFLAAHQIAAAGSRPSARAYRDAAAGRTTRRPAPPRPCARHT